MKKSILASLLVPALIAGCGSSSNRSNNSGTTTTTSYQWQIVQLASVTEINLGSNCVIYADSTDYDAAKVGEVVTAYKATAGFNILYHNTDGSIAKTFSVSDVTADGVFTVNLDEVPDDGYVTLEEAPTGSITIIDRTMFSVQKSLLSDMVLNVTTGQSASCVEGDDHRKAEFTTKYVTLAQASDSVSYYQSSYDEKTVDGKSIATNLPVKYIENGTRDVLITAFEDYEASNNDHRTGLTYWTFVDKSKIFDENENSLSSTSDMNLAYDQVMWDFSDISIPYTLSDDSAVVVLHEDNTYLWQPIYDGSYTVTVDYVTEEVDVWNSYFAGEMDLSSTGAGDWDFVSFNTLAEEPTLIELMDPSSSIIGSLTNASVEESCNAETDFCVDLEGVFDNDSFTHQRLHLRLEESTTGNIYFVSQTIISKANSKPVVLEASQVEFLSPTLKQIELNLMHSDAANPVDAVQYLMTENIDTTSFAVAYANAGNETFNDKNGYVTTAAETQSLYQKMLATNTTIVQSAYEQP